MHTNKLKTATVTWIYYYNFGTYLQAYALQHTLKQLGFENAIIDDKAIVTCGLHTPFKERLVHMLKDVLKFVLYNYQRLSVQSTSSYKRFRREYLNIDSTFANPTELNERYDAFIAGSDQIWFYKLLNPYFFLDFATKRKISYAPSAGTHDYSESDKPVVGKLLQRFHAVSVREPQSISIIQPLAKQTVTAVLDPTLLLPKEEWEKLVAPQPHESSYYLGYMLTYNENYLRYLRDKAHAEGKQLIIFATDKRYMKYADKCVAAGPCEFLTYIKHADCVYTDSFHATVFSVLFERDFYTLKRFKEGDSMNQNFRLNNLFTLIQVNDRFIGESDLEGAIHPKTLDFTQIKSRIEVERTRSIRFLTQSLS